MRPVHFITFDLRLWSLEVAKHIFLFLRNLLRSPVVKWTNFILVYAYGKSNEFHHLKRWQMIHFYSYRVPYCVSLETEWKIKNFQLKSKSIKFKMEQKQQKIDTNISNTLNMFLFHFEILNSRQYSKFTKFLMNWSKNMNV